MCFLAYMTVAKVIVRDGEEERAAPRVLAQLVDMFKDVPLVSVRCGPLDRHGRFVFTPCEAASPVAVGALRSAAAEFENVRNMRSCFDSRKMHVTVPQVFRMAQDPPNGGGTTWSCKSCVCAELGSGTMHSVMESERGICAGRLRGFMW